MILARREEPIVSRYRDRWTLSRREIKEEDEVSGLGFGGPGEPDAFLATGVYETGDFFEASSVDPKIHLLGCGAAGREDDPALLLGDPTSLDSGEGFLPGVGINTELDSAGWKAGSVPAHGCFQPTPGGRIVVLRQNPASTGKAGFSGGEVGTKEQDILFLHRPGETAKKGERIEVGQNTEESEQARPGAAGDRRWEMGGKIDPAGYFSNPRQAMGGPAGEREVGIGGEEKSRLGESLEKQELLGPLCTTQGNQGVGPG